MNPFEVLAQPMRRRIVEVLASGEHTAGTLEEIGMTEFGVGRSAVQHHLAYLRRIDWIIGREEETTHWYRLDPSVVRKIEREVKRLRRLWDRRIGWMEDTDPLPGPDGKPRLVSKKGRRGRGVDPDDPWFLLARRGW
jgi:DNA-binding transcriptional ArsR family regulator